MDKIIFTVFCIGSAIFLFLYIKEIIRNFRKSVPSEVVNASILIAGMIFLFAVVIFFIFGS